MDISAEFLQLFMFLIPLAIFLFAVIIFVFACIRNRKDRKMIEERLRKIYD